MSRNVGLFTRKQRPERCSGLSLSGKAAAFPDKGMQPARGVSQRLLSAKT